jgi:CxxC motif-containing protein (DUF1111 family)
MNKFKTFGLSFSIALLLVAVACQKLSEKVTPKSPNENTLLDGPVDGLTPEQTKTFLAGDRAFNDEIFTPETGLGTIFVTNSCGSCHAGDGKGHPSTTLTRFGSWNNGVFDHMPDMGGPQLQNRAIPGHEPEQVPEGANVAKFTPPANTGLGFLEAVTDADLLFMADPNDADRDGISGVPNYIEPPDFFIPKSWHIANGGKYIGRFGKKAAAIDLLHQTANAYLQDMGITSDYRMEDQYNYMLGDNTTDNISDPEVPASTVKNVVFYLQTLKAPIQREQNKAPVISGNQLFKTIGCNKCHQQTLKTGNVPIAALSNKEFHPYTDLLLHDMGPGLDDGYTEGTAQSSEWRTPPLWGLGLSPNSQGGQYFLMHDGRAKSIEEAILLHGGEGENSRVLYNQLSESDKKQLIEFLKSL